MSFIHSRQHEYVGELADAISMYLPLEDIDVPDEVVANVGEILLGGGGGELAAWVIHPETAVLEVVEQALFTNPTTFSPEAAEALQRLGITEDDYADFMDVLVPLDGPNALTRTWPTWNGDEWYYVVTKAMEDGYDRSKHYSIETWLLQQVGAWVLTSRPELLTVDFNEKQQSILRVAKTFLTKEVTLTKD